MPRRIVIAVVVALLAAVAPITGLGSSPASAADPLPDFYTVPDPLPAGAPGEIIKSELVSAPGLHGSMWRVMYHSQSILGQDIAVTGLVAVPGTTPPADGFHVVSWAHGTTGLADICAPSLAPADNAGFLNLLLDGGYLVTATDYEGLGTPGRHPYIVGDSEARSSIDIVRAARNMPDAHASSEYLVWGHSQGGHAAMFSLHIAADWAPELHIVGVVAGAPPSQLSLLYQALLGSPFRHYILMAAAGFNAAYGDEGAPLDKVLTQEGIDTLHFVDEGCAGYVAENTAGIPAGDLTKADPNDVPEWAKLLHDNDPGQFATPVDTPLLIIQGGNDEQIPVVSTQLMFDQLCATGQTEQRWIYPGQSHAGVVGPSFTDMKTWIDHRFAGEQAPDVTPTGQPDVQAQSCPDTTPPPPPPTEPPTTVPIATPVDESPAATPVDSDPTFAG